MHGKIAASMMCANFAHLENDVRILENAGVEYLHIDVMDGHFVPNLTLGPDYVNALREISDIPMDIHLMVENPENWVDIFKPQRGDLVVVHQEATCHLQRVLHKIRYTGATAGVALNPATPLVMIENVMEDVGVVLVMTVNPGYAGQKLVPQTLQKIAVLRQQIESGGYSIEIEVDGNVDLENAIIMRNAGADIFVAGSSGLFIPRQPLAESLKRLRQAIQ